MTGTTNDRVVLHRVAAHVLSRRRSTIAGKIGLRATPGGIGTPAFGPDAEVVRIAAGHLVHERAAGTRTLSIGGSTLRELAAFVGEDIDAPVALGKDAPAVGDGDARMAFDGRSLAAWFHRAWLVLDTLVQTVGEASNIQIWPEHFDAATDVPAGAGRANVGASPGDGFHPEPYFYVGPWDAARPGDDGYWNAPFGAFLDGDDRDDAAVVAWMEEGLSRLREPGT